MSDQSGIPDVMMVLPTSTEIAEPDPIDGYSVRVLPTALDSWWVDIHRKAVPAWKPAQLRPWLAEYRGVALKNGILLATDDVSNKPVSTAGSIASTNDDMFPNGGQLAWVATVPDQRKRGLSTWLCALAVRRLRKDGHEKIFLFSGDDLGPALRLYFSLGFLPCLYKPGEREHWESVCKAIDHPFKPKLWPTPEDYVKG